MAKHYLGDQIDIHAGGEDLIFPHHENEIAQSECANDKTFANYWMHNGFLNIYYIQSKLGTVLDIDAGVISQGRNVQTYALNESNAQKWKLSKVNYVDVAEGTYTIQTALSANKVLDVLGASNNNGANVQIYNKNGTFAQNFVLKKVSTHEYQITCEKSGKALDVAGASANAGANVWQYSKTIQMHRSGEL